MSIRRSIRIPGFHHGTNPIPNAAVVGSVLMSGGVSGVDRAEGTLPSRVEDAIQSMFDNIVAVLEAAGGSMDMVVRIEVTLEAVELRDALNAEWIRRFPDEASRPARKVEVSASLPPGCRTQCTFTAVLGE